MPDMERLTTAWSGLDSELLALLRPITDDTHYRQVLDAVSALMERLQDSDGGSPLGSLLELLVDRVTAYEAELLPVPERSPRGALAYLMEDRGLTQTALGMAVGTNPSTLSKLLNGERDFTADHARRLAAHFGCDVGMFVQGP